MGKPRKPPPASPPPLRLEYVDPDTLDNNPHNWRRHPEKQLNAVRDVIAEVGWAGALLYNERTKRLIDGHARKRIAKGPVPVLIGNWSEEQEKKILATLDPIGAMATADVEALKALVADVRTDSGAVAAVLEDLVPAKKAPKAEGGGSVTDTWRILIECKSEEQQLELLERFEKEGLACRALTL